MRACERVCVIDKQFHEDVSIGPPSASGCGSVTTVRQPCSVSCSEALSTRPPARNVTQPRLYTQTIVGVQTVDLVRLKTPIDDTQEQEQPLVAFLALSNCSFNTVLRVSTFVCCGSSDICSVPFRFLPDSQRAMTHRESWCVFAIRRFVSHF